MSAHCSTCGTDIVYPEGTWPIGVCPVCSRGELLEKLTRLIALSLNEDVSYYERLGRINEALWEMGLGPQLGTTLCDPRGPARQEDGDV